MKIYHYHPVTREFIKETDARVSPLEPEVFLIPAHATAIVPPAAGKNQVAVFLDGEWTIQPDFRGPWFKGRERTHVFEIGPLPDGYTAEPTPLTADEIRQAQADEIRSRYAATLIAIAAPYGAAERETWKTQEEEARQWTADPNTPCPMIRAMATTRGITMELMVAKILNSAERFRAASGQILGLQQAELDLLYPEKKEEV